MVIALETAIIALVLPVMDSLFASVLCNLASLAARWALLAMLD